VDWVGKGFGRLYEGIPKINIPWPINKKFPDPRWMLSLTNIPEKLGIFHKAFFTDKPMEKGEEKTEETQETSGSVTNVSTVRRDTKGARAGDFVMASDGTLGVFDGMGTRGLRAGEQELYNSGATNIDGSKPSSTSVATTSNAGYWGPLLETIAKKESVGGSYDSIYPGTTKQKRYGGKALTEMTIREADAWQASTYRERGSAAAGRYQFMSILSQATTYSDVKPDDLFNAENQDKMAIGLIVNKRKITPEMIKNDPNKAMLRLAQEWAAFPVPTDMQGHKQFVKAGQSYYAGDGRNASGATVAEMRAAFAKLGAPPVQSQQPQTPNVQPQTPLVEGQKKTAVLAYGTNDWGLSESEIKKRATEMIRDLMSKGYNVVVVPPNKDLNVKGYGKKDAPYRGVYSAAAETGATIESGKYQTVDTLHLEPADAKRIFNKYRSAVYVGDSNAVRMKASESGDYSNTSTAVSGAGGDAIKEQIDSSVETVSTRQATPDNSEKMASQDQSDSDTSSASSPAQVSASPQVQTQMSSGISGISQQLPYEQSGSTVVMMQGSGGQQMPMGGGGGKGTPIIMGSGDVVNSYYKSQLMGFLYKQG
jgi:muramidase (phage lysozyme)